MAGAAFFTRSSTDFVAATAFSQGEAQIRGRGKVKCRFRDVQILWQGQHFLDFVAGAALLQGQLQIRGRGITFARSSTDRELDR